MNYSTGVVNSWDDMRSAIISELVTNHGWTLNGTILSKGSAFLTLTVSSSVVVTQGPGLILQGGTGISAGNLVNPSGVQPRMGRGSDAASEPSWPATFHLFAFDTPAEVYCILNFDGDKHLFCAFGLSSVSLPGSGSGLWLAASSYKRLSLATTVVPIPKQWAITNYGGGYEFNSNLRLSSGGPFWGTIRSAGNPDSMSDTVHHGFDSGSWSEGGMTVSASSGYQSTAIAQGALHAVPAAYAHISRSPSPWNQESPIIPIKGYVQRASNKCSLALDLVNARYVRVDNYAPGEVITLGPDRWKVFPFYLKSTDARDGSASLWLGGSIDHSGTFGWAIRYDGP